MAPPLEVFLLFLRFGLTAFGGPLAHLALFEEELVVRRRWLSRERFLERISLTQLISGPNSTELAMLLGFERAGWPGFFLAGLAFATPAVVLVAALAALYGRLGGFGEVERWVWGTKPVVAALIGVMVFRSLRQTLPLSWRLVPIAAGFAAYVAAAPAISALALAAALARAGKRDARAVAAFLLAAALPLVPWPFSVVSSVTISLPALFAQMFSLGSVVLGSGYVLFSYLSARFVTGLHWVSPEILALAIAAGQLTPGPLFASAAFFGQVLRGAPGAAVAAAGIFAPAFLFSGLSIPLARRLETSARWRDCLPVMAAVSVLMLARETLHLAPLWLNGPFAWGIALVTGLAFLRFRVNSSLLVLLGALAGGLVNRPF